MVKVEITKGDITQADAEAIVNPANNYLMHGGGLAAAIVKAGGQVIQQESKKIGFVPTGSAVITSGGHLKAKHVIHAVGPKYKDGKSGEEEKLGSAVKSSLELAEKKKLKSLAIPAISSGIFGYPVEESSRIIIGSINDYLKQNKETTLESIIVCLYDDDSYDTFKKQYESIFRDSGKTTGKAKTTRKTKSEEADTPKKSHKEKVKQDYPKK